MDRPDDATTPTGSPTGSPPASVPVTVVGAGTMGSGIARACLEAGHPVRLHDAFEAAVDRAAERIDAGLRRAATKAGADAGDPDETLANLRTSHGAGDDALADVARDAAVVIEAVPEDAGLKRAAWAALGEGAPAGALLGSNTSSLSITELGAASGRAADLCGLHFFHPVARLPLVELVRGERTTDEVLDRAEAFVLGLGKTPVRGADRPGFLVNRLLIPYLNDAARLVDEGAATPDAVDRAMTLGANVPLGPLALADLIGLDVVLSVLEILHAELGDPRYAPAPIVRRKVRAGLLGRKSGAGFYDYGGDA